MSTKLSHVTHSLNNNSKLTVNSQTYSPAAISLRFPLYMFMQG